MLGAILDFLLPLVYIFTCGFAGYVICSLFFKNLNTITEKSLTGVSINLSKWLVMLPAWYISGTIAVTWLVYIFGYIFKGMDKPLAAANAIVIPLFLAISYIGFLYLKKKNSLSGKGLFSGTQKCELILLAAAFTLISVLMWRTFYVDSEDVLQVGYSVFSDFSPHIGMIRSFSYGNNFPTAYSHFAGEDIRYHFMFQFLVGNLEFLGMRIDFAFNIPSTISLLCVFCLLYVLAVKLFSKRAVGVLACAFFAFRCSPSFFTYLFDLIKSGAKVWETLWSNSDFIGYTTHEDWGLWNLNVYCNQRHLALCLAVMLLILIMFIPSVFHLTKRISDIIAEEGKKSKKKEKFLLLPYKEACMRKLFLQRGMEGKKSCNADSGRYFTGCLCIL